MRRWLAALLGLMMAWHGALHAGELAERLKGANHVLVMRHAYAPGVGDPPGYSLDKCESQRILNDEGKQQSVRIGQWLRRQGVAKADVYASIWCRCRQTAERLALGPVTLEPSLASFFDEPDQAAAQNKRLQDFVAMSLKRRSRPHSGHAPCQHSRVHGQRHRLWRHGVGACECAGPGLGLQNLPKPLTLGIGHQ
jgi:phosphohistidine phosphatase SixA